MKKKIIIVAVAALVVGLAGGFFIGKGSVSRSPYAQAGQNAAGGMRRGGGFQTGGGLITGNIISSTDNSITVQSRDGSSRIVFFGSSAEISKFAKGAASDLSVGQSVVVSGTSNSDGSINAQTIQVRPPMPAGAATGTIPQYGR